MKKEIRKFLAWVALAVCAVCLIRFTAGSRIPGHFPHLTPNKGDEHLEISDNIIVEVNMMKNIG